MEYAIAFNCFEKQSCFRLDQVVTNNIGLCQLESMRSEVMQITFNCQNSIVFLMRDFLHLLCHVQGSEFRQVNKRNGFR